MTITQNKNFLNNQNYILGKTEKKKLLSKFFVEKTYGIICYLLFIIEKMWYYISLFTFGYLFVLPDFSGFHLYSINNFIDGFFAFLGILGTLFLYGIFIFGFLLLLFTAVKKNKYVRSKKISDYFYSSTWMNLLLLLVLFLIVIFTIIYLINYEIIFYIFSFLLFIFFSLFIGYTSGKKINFKEDLSFRLLNVINILFFPLVILFLLFYFLIITPYIFIIKGVKGYLIYKKKFGNNLLEKFSELEKGYAENDYYLIESK